MIGAVALLPAYLEGSIDVCHLPAYYLPLLHAGAAEHYAMLDERQREASGKRVCKTVATPGLPDWTRHYVR